jgi:hypothetical protein
METGRETAANGIIDKFCSNVVDGVHSQKGHEASPRKIFTEFDDKVLTQSCNQETLGCRRGPRPEARGVEVRVTLESSCEGSDTTEMFDTDALESREGG